MAKWILKNATFNDMITIRGLSFKDIEGLKVKGQKIFHANETEKRVGVAIFISDKIICNKR